MSEPISALNHASYDGIAKVEEIGLQGMITLRGDLSDKVLAKAVKDATGQKMPGQREALVNGDTGRLLDVDRRVAGACALCRS